MFGTSKLRPDFSLSGIGQPIIALAIYAIIWALFDITAALVWGAVVFAIYALISLIFLRRTGNLWYIVPFVFQATIIIITLKAPKIGIYAMPASSFKPLTILLAVEFMLLIYIILTKKLKWHGREILEMAARNVSETSNGFTERPRPMGKIDFSKTELEGFKHFLKSNLILWPVNESRQSIFIPVCGGDEYLLPLGFSSNYAENTWVSLDEEGNVSVQISKKDYLKYKEALAFDQLVESLGQLFILLFERYKNGEGKRIVYELNSMNSFPFS